jgi:hypothetical protein
MLASWRGMPFTPHRSDRFHDPFRRLQCGAGTPAGCGRFRHLFPRHVHVELRLRPLGGTPEGNPAALSRYLSVIQADAAFNKIDYGMYQPRKFCIGRSGRLLAGALVEGARHRGPRHSRILIRARKAGSPRSFAADAHECIIQQRVVMTCPAKLARIIRRMQADVA